MILYKLVRGEELKSPKSDKSIFLKTMNAHLFLGEASRYKKNNAILIDDSPKKNILNNVGNAIFLKSWKHTVRNSASNAYLTTNLRPWLERLHKEGYGEVSGFVNSNQLGVNPLVPGDVLYDLVMDKLRPKQTM